jgi:hypothetical protein
MEQPFIKVPEITDTSACPAPDFPDMNTHLKRVLLEDYTGHTCPNCPAAGVIARDIADQHPDQVIVMAVHAGWFARTYPESGVPEIYDYDFRTDAGTAWDATFGNGNAGNPNGLVNRLKVNNKYVLRPSEWGGVVNDALSEQPELDLQLLIDFDADSRKICVHTRTHFLQTLDLNLKLETVVIEDSIIAAQKNNDASVGTVGDIPDFVHMHVLRGALNGTWGTTLAQTGVQNPAQVVKSIQSELPVGCIPKNCHIIAFVFDSDSREVLQAAEADLIE